MSARAFRFILLVGNCSLVVDENEFIHVICNNMECNYVFAYGDKERPKKNLDPEDRYNARFMASAKTYTFGLSKSTDLRSANRDSKLMGLSGSICPSAVAASAMLFAWLAYSFFELQ